MEGLFLVNKPRGLSSRALGVEIKKLLNIDKVGHVGTLDVEASGLLMILSGSATRLQNYFLDSSKVYEGSILLGMRSDTDDIYGECVETVGAKDLLQSLNGEELVLNIRNTFSPSYFQIPAAISSKKIKGVNARVLYRQGIVTNLAAKEVTLSFSRLIYDGEQRLHYEIEVSSGFYVRALARDIGEMLSVGAVTESIFRTRVGSFSINNAAKFEIKGDHFICSVDELCSGFIPLNKLANYLDLASVILDSEEKKQFFFGNKKVLEKFSGITDQNVCVLDDNHLLIGLVSIHNGAAKFEVVFNPHYS